MTARTARSAALAALLLASPAALADPPGPKVCVAVAGDPDEAVRASADALTDALSRREGLRGVADADARAALRGEAVAAASDVADLAAARRALRGEDRDAAALDGVAARLGCGLVVELMARPAGTLVRVYDPVQHTWPASRELAAIDAATLDAVVVPALAARSASAADAGAPATDGGAQPATGAASPAANRTAAVDRRAAPAARSPQRSAWSTAWPWVAVGGVALAVVGAYFLAQDGATTSTTRVTVVHPGVP
jgi:hypothetical protein